MIVSPRHHCQARIQRAPRLAVHAVRFGFTLMRPFPSRHQSIKIRIESQIALGLVLPLPVLILVHYYTSTLLILVVLALVNLAFDYFVVFFFFDCFNFTCLN